MQTVRAYVDGVEIDKIPELAQVCAMDDWLQGLLEWASKNRPELRMDAIFMLEGKSIEDAVLSEVWIGGSPPMRAESLGGIKKSFYRKGTGRGRF